MEDLGRMLGEMEPDTLIMISPHSPLYRDAFTLKLSPDLGGSFSSFGQPGIRISKRNDVDLADAILDEAESAGLDLEPVKRPPSSSAEELDHGLLVPLYFLDKVFESRIICLSISGLDYGSHFQLGRIARRACSRLARRALFVASGDLSHRLARGAPAGYSPRGVDFDRLIVEIAENGDFDRLYDIREDLVEDAGECGFRSIHCMWGALKDSPLTNSVLSYEGPFGVGYLVSLHQVVEEGG